MKSLFRSLSITIFLLSIFFIIIEISFAFDSQLKLTLNDCIQRAFERSDKLKTSYEEMILSRYQWREARRDFFPETRISLSDNNIIDAEEFSYYDPQTGQSYIPGEGYEFSLQIIQPIYSGSELSSNLKAERIGEKIKTLQYAKQKRDLRLEITQSYISVLEREAELIIRNEQLSRSIESLKLAKARLNAGKGIRFEVLSEKSYLGTSELEQLKAEHAFKEAKRTLKILLNISLVNDIVLEQIEFRGPEEGNIDALIESAIAQREEITELRYLIQQSKSRLKSLRSISKPKLDLFATYQKQGNSISDINDDENRYELGLNFSFSPFKDSTLSAGMNRSRIDSNDYLQRNYIYFSLFDGSSNITQQISYEIEIQKWIMEFNKIRDQIRNEVFTAYENRQESWKRVETEQLNLDADQENYRIQQKRYNLGLSHYKDVVDARADVVEAKINLNYAKYLYTLDQAILDHSLGRKIW